MSLLDAEPLLSETTLRFWDWMSGHYCCSPGEVALAALPAGMRLASETKLQPAPDAEERDDSGLDDREFQVVEALRLRGAMTFREVGDLLGVKDPAPVLRSLVETGWILSNEEMRAAPAEKWCPWCGFRSGRWPMRAGSENSWMPWMPGRLPNRGR